MDDREDARLRALIDHHAGLVTEWDILENGEVIMLPGSQEHYDYAMAARVARATIARLEAERDAAERLAAGLLDDRERDFESLVELLAVADDEPSQDAIDAVRRVTRQRGVK